MRFYAAQFSLVLGFIFFISLGIFLFYSSAIIVAQNPQGDTIKLGTFSPTIEPPDTPVPTSVRPQPTTPLFTPAVTRQLSSPPRPTVSPSSSTVQPLHPNCHFEEGDFTDFREYGGFTYARFTKTVTGKGEKSVPGWYWIFSTHTEKNAQEIAKSLYEFAQNVPIDPNDLVFRYNWSRKFTNCRSYYFTYCAYYVAQQCVDCPVDQPAPKLESPYLPRPFLSSAPEPTKVPTQVSTPLCTPVEVNGSSADKMDILIIPLNFTTEEFNSRVLPLAKRAVQALGTTNLSNHPEDILKKMNWYLLNVHDPSFPIENFRQFENGDREALINFGVQANYCGRDRFMIILKGEGDNGFAIRNVGGVAMSENVEGDGLTFVHEWGHAVGGLMDEYPGAANSIIAANCTTTPSSQTRTGNYSQPCPAWDCSKISCSPKASQLLSGMGCYPRCGTTNYYRPMQNSIMDYIEGPGGNVFSGPALVHMIEKVFAKYK